MSGDAMTLAHIQRGRGFVISLGENSPCTLPLAPESSYQLAGLGIRYAFGHSLSAVLSNALSQQKH